MPTPPEPPDAWPLLPDGGRLRPEADPEAPMSRRDAVVLIGIAALAVGAGIWLGGPEEDEERRAPPTSYTDQAEWERCVADESSATDGNTVLTPQEVCSVAYPAYNGPGSVDPFSDTFGPDGIESGPP